MIDRYTLPEMGRVWSDQHKYELWCRVETLVLETHAKAGRVPAALRDHGLAHRETIKVGRTHGVHAEPVVWGHRVADLAFGMARSRDRLRAARARVGVVAISGAVGTYSLIDPSVEGHVAEALGLRPADASAQVVLRDGISEWVSALAIIATVCEAIALEVRHGQR